MSRDEPTRRETTSGARPRLTAEARPVAELTADERRRMFEIMAGHFENVSPSQFFADLDEKDVVVVMNDAASCELRGFSTIGRVTAIVDDRPVLALFSGDTVIEPDFWGENAWLSVWARYAFSQADRMAPEPL
ncbi:MAG TPA: hypothetical protein VGJ26_18420, partial [Pirellulales bacterium]